MESIVFIMFYLYLTFHHFMIVFVSKNMSKYGKRSVYISICILYVIAYLSTQNLML